MDAVVVARRRAYVTAAAVHLVIASRHDPRTMAAVRGATLAVPDGQPLVWALRLLEGCGRDMGIQTVKRRHGRKAALALRRARSVRPARGTDMVGHLHRRCPARAGMRSEERRPDRR
jgi:hypothetical protein